MINEQIKNLRKEKGLTQQQLAQELKIGQASISDWERGLYEPTASAIRALAIFFDITADELLEIEHKNETNSKYINSFNNTNISNSGNIKF